MKPSQCRLPKPRRKTPIIYPDLAPGLLHVLVYGPGEGEAIIVVFPDGSLGVLDGCMEPVPEEGKLDPVSEFIQTAPTSVPVRFVGMTHPHDDHYGGLGALLAELGDRVEEIWSTGLVEQRYHQALQQHAELLFDQDLPDSGLKRRGITGFLRVLLDRWDRWSELVARKELLVLPCPGEPSVHLCGCGPADGDKLQAVLQGASFYHHLISGELPPRELDPNLTSGAVHVRWGEAGVLLGGDQLIGHHEKSGWNANAAIFQDHKTPLWKAAHHASEGAHHPASWEHHNPLLTIVTPFKRATKNQPPKRAQLLKLAETSCVLLTAWPAWYQPASNLLARSGGLHHEPATRPSDRRNAVAVTLDHGGTVVQILLSGEAFCFDG